MDRNTGIGSLTRTPVEVKGFEFAGWREVPVHKDKLGVLAREAMPSIYQFFLRAPGIEGDALEIVHFVGGGC